MLVCRTNIKTTLDPFGLLLGRDLISPAGSGWVGPTALVRKRLELVFSGGRLLVCSPKYRFSRILLASFVRAFLLKVRPTTRSVSISTVRACHHKRVAWVLFVGVFSGWLLFILRDGAPRARPWKVFEAVSAESPGFEAPPRFRSSSRERVTLYIFEFDLVGPVRPLSPLRLPRARAH